MNNLKPVHLLLLCLVFFGNRPGHGQTPAALPASENILYQFGATSTDAEEPDSAPMVASDGNFYGVTFFGGTYGYGALYQLTPVGKYQVLYSFTGGKDGGYPNDTPFEGSDGNLYGLTNSYGLSSTDNTGGTIYQYNLKTGTLTTLYSFANGGRAGFTDPVDDGKGTIYGTAQEDDPSGNNLGGIWSYNYLTNTFKTLHTFTGTDGKNPVGGMVLATDGNLYGTTNAGGLYGTTGASPITYGTAFVISTDGSNFHVIHNFSNGTQGTEDGFAPSASLVEGPDGNLYSFTFEGGQLGNASGVFYRIIPSGASSSFQAVYSFKAGDGNYPLHGRPSLGGDGNFYLAGSIGGLYSGGQVMQISPSGTKADVYDFNPLTDDGFDAQAAPIEGADGNLYGTAPAGGPAHRGNFFELLTTLPPAISLTANSNAVKNGVPVTLTWAVTNAFSTNAKVCYAYSSDDSWTGSLATSGTATVTPAATNSIVLFAMTCGGVETATAQVVVGTIPPQITTGGLPGGVTRSAYSQKLGELGGVAPFTWSLSSGTLPGGLTLDPAAGIISGVPTTPGTFTFTVEITDSESTPQSATASFSITVVHAPLVTPTVTLTLTPQSMILGSTVTFTAVVNGLSGVPAPTGSVQFASNGSPIGDPIPLTNGAATLPNQDPTITGTYGISASYSGDSNYTPGNLAIGTLTVTTPTTASILATPDTVTITAPGSSGSTTLKLVNFSSGSMTFTCQGLPVGAKCSFGAVSSSATSTLQITTAGSSSASLTPPAHPDLARTFYALALPGLLGLGGLFSRRKRLGRVKVLLLALFLLSAAGTLTGCSNNQPAPTNPTPSGSSTVIVSATNGTQTAVVQLTLVVQ